MPKQELKVCYNCLKNNLIDGVKFSKKIPKSLTLKGLVCTDCVPVLLDQLDKQIKHGSNSIDIRSLPQQSIQSQSKTYY